MSAIQDQGPPLPLPSLLIQPFKEGLRDRGGAHQRYLVDSGTVQRVVGEDVRVLLELLRARPANWSELQDQFCRAIGHPIEDAELRRLVHGQLPRDWFIEATVIKRRSPFVLQYELFEGKTLEPLTRALSMLFRWTIAAPLLAAFVVVQMLAIPEAASRMQGPSDSLQVLALLGALVPTMLLHELGHLSACARTRTPHGGLGVGLYWVFPAMYADVSQAWRMDPADRLLVDVGGLYFQAFSVVAIGIYALTFDSDFAYRLQWVVTFTMLHTLNPFFKFDGYWILSDAAGITNLHKQVRETFLSALARLTGRTRSAEHALQRGTLWVLYAYSLLSLGYFAYTIQYLVTQLRLQLHGFPTSLNVHWASLETAAGRGVVADAASAAAQIATLVIWPSCLALFALMIGFALLRRVHSVLGELRLTARS